MKIPRPPALAGSPLTIVLVVTLLLAGSATLPREVFFPALQSTGAPTASADRSRPGRALAVPAALTTGGLSLRAGPVAVPLQLQLPTIGVNASVLGVGITAANVMDAPMGKADDPVWQQAFWYRGSAIPGSASSALIAGHISDSLGRPGVFAYIDRLRPGDPIVVQDTRTGLDVRFAVVDSKSYALDEATDQAVLTEIYGAGPVAGKWPEPSADGLSHLTLITCAGVFQQHAHTHDHRLVVHATRVP